MDSLLLVVGRALSYAGSVVGEFLCTHIIISLLHIINYFWSPLLDFYGVINIDIVYQFSFPFRPVELYEYLSVASYILSKVVFSS